MRNMTKAVFLDRDGVVNRLVYRPEIDTIDSPCNAARFRLLPGVAEAIKTINALDMKAIVVSNQPGIAYGKFKKRDLLEMNQKMIRAIKRKGAFLDDIFYCLHHPEVGNSTYRKRCGCRKPKAGLIYMAARKHGIALKKSYMVGDNLTDISAGNKAGCVTLLLGRMKCVLCKHIETTAVRPDYIVKDLPGAVRLIKQIEKKKVRIK